MEKLGIFHGVSQRYVILYKDNNKFNKLDHFTWKPSVRAVWGNKIAGKELVEWLD